MGINITSRIRCKPGDHFTFPCRIRIPDFFEKVEQEEAVNQQSSPYSHPQGIPDFQSRVLYEDNHVLVINKPSGICCQVIELVISLFLASDW